MKKCTVASNCYWGNALTPGYCGYDENLKEDAICPRLVDAWDAAPDNFATRLFMKRKSKNEKTD